VHQGRTGTGPALTPRTGSSRRTPAWIWLFATAAAAYGLDRATKIWAEDRLAGHAPITLIAGVLDLNYTTNSGGAFGLAQSAWWIFAAATIGVSVAIVVGATRIHRTVTGVALGLILGGALGNVIDRVRFGYVVDFVDLYWRDWHFWAFNVADAAITFGVALMILDLLGIGRHRVSRAV